MMRGRKPDAMAVRRGMNPLAVVDDGARGVAMPPDIAADPVLKEIWGWICPPVNTFSEQDVPTLRELTTWHAVFEQCRQVLLAGDGKVNIFDKVGVKPFKTPDGREVPLVRNNPAISIMKQASAEIRALSDMLGLSPLARSRIGLMDATTVKTAADTAAMFATIDEAYAIEADYEAD